FDGVWRIFSLDKWRNCTRPRSRRQWIPYIRTGPRRTTGANMSEKILFEQEGVSVSNARFVVNGATYPISAITSVRAVRSKKFPFLALVLILVGFGILLGGEPTLLIFAVAAMALGVVWFVKTKEVYSVVLQTSSGESQVLESKDRQYIHSV